MNILRILYPKRCPVCDNVRKISEEGICRECKKKLIKVSDIEYYEKDKAIIQRFYDGGRCLYGYSSIFESLYRFKYMNRIEYGNSYGKAMATEFSDWLSGLKADALIPVPISKKRLIKRGYNQAEELTREISRLTEIPMAENVIARLKNTLPQKYKDKKGRIINMKNAFIVTENVVNFRRVVIIDDIFTTGSTIDAIAAELKRAGVKEVYFLCLSRAGI